MPSLNETHLLCLSSLSRTLLGQSVLDVRTEQREDCWRPCGEIGSDLALRIEEECARSDPDDGCPCT